MAVMAGAETERRMIDPQDPLPEPKFTYRRIFSYGVSLALLAILGLIVWRIDDGDALRQLALYLCVLLFFVITYYMVAPSAEQIVKLIQSARVLVATRQDKEDNMP